MFRLCILFLRNSASTLLWIWLSIFFDICIFVQCFLHRQNWQARRACKRKIQQKLQNIYIFLYWRGGGIILLSIPQQKSNFPNANFCWQTFGENIEFLLRKLGKNYFFPTVHLFSLCFKSWQKMNKKFITHDTILI